MFRIEYNEMNSWVFRRAQELIETGIQAKLAYVLARREWHEPVDPELSEIYGD